MSKQPSAIIIGAGIAGLATAIRLAVQGFHTVVFEKNTYPGGKLSAFEKEGFYFDAGPSLFTQPGNIEALFALANEPIDAYLQYERLPVVCKYFYADGNIVEAHADATLFANELAAKFGEEAQQVSRYLADAKALYNNIGTVFLNHSLHKRKSLFSPAIRQALSATKAKYLVKTLHQFNQQSFSKPATVQLFDRFATYNGSNPYKAPGMLSLIPHLEQNEGAYYVKGGMISITNALYKLAKKLGVAFHFDAAVERIIDHDGRVKGVVVNQENHHANIVVSNSDVYFSYKNLVQDPVKAKKLLKQERSSSALIFYWGINKIFPQLQLHNIFFSNNYQQEFHSIFRLKSLANDLTVYVNVTSTMEPSLAPAGKQNWFVMVNAPANIGQNWDKLKQHARRLIIQKLSSILGEDIEALIAIEETLDPVKIEETTSSYQGSLYGTSSNSRMAAFVRHPNFSSAIKGLYFVGGSVHPGGGIPLCLKSAAITSDIIEADKKKLLSHH
jgi:phytoene desaturase